MDGETEMTGSLCQRTGAPSKNNSETCNLLDVEDSISGQHPANNAFERLDVQSCPPARLRAVLSPFDNCVYTAWGLRGGM